MNDIKLFLKPNKEKLMIFSILIPVTIVIIVVGFSLESHLDSPSFINPITQLVPDDWWWGSPFYLFVLGIYLLGILLSLPALVLLLLFSPLITNPDARLAFFVIFEIGYLYVIACTINHVLENRSGRVRRK